jgi:thiamine pyrophosphokinase
MAPSEVVLVGPVGPVLSDRFLNHRIIAVDGGARFVERFDLWVGDADSIEGDRPEGPRIDLLPEKDRSDLVHALESIQDPVRVLHLWGFLGGRRDHEWFNLGEVARWIANARGVQARFYDEQGEWKVAVLTEGEIDHEGVFSLGSIEPNRVRITGECEYPLSEWTELHPVSSHGLSNRAFGRVRVEADGPVILFFEES